ncbi:hypothetical protein GCM10027610_074170 [Dactylosporangium cerinum]
MRAGDEQADGKHRLAQPADGAGPGDAVPVLVEPLHAGAQAEPQPAAGQLVQVERGQRGEERAAGEGQGDAGAHPDRAGAGGERGGGDGGAAVQLGRPDDGRPGGLGPVRRVKLLLERLAPRLEMQRRKRHSVTSAALRRRPDFNLRS